MIPLGNICSNACQWNRFTLRERQGGEGAADRPPHNHLILRLTMQFTSSSLLNQSLQYAVYP